MLAAAQEQPLIVAAGEPKKAPVRSLGTWLRTVAYIGPHWPRAAFCLFSILLDIAFAAVLPLSIKFLVDDAIPNQDGALLVRILGGLAILFLVQAAVSTARDRVQAGLVARVLNDLRFGMLQRLQRLSIDFFQRRQVGDLLAYFANDLAAIENLIGGALPGGLRAVIEATVNLALLFLLFWPLALAMIVLVPLALIGPRLLSPKAVQAGFQRKQLEAKLSGTATQDIGGQPLIRAFGLQSFILGQFRAQLDEVLQATVRSSFIAALVGRTTYVAVTLAELVIIGLGSWLVFRGDLAVGALVAFVGILLNVGSAFSSLSSAVRQWLEGTGSMRRIDELLHEPLPPTEDAAIDTVGRLSNEIRFENVSFGYDAWTMNLRHLDFAIPARRFVAFVGQSGSGKSTILNLLMRFYPPSEGRIRLDGHDLPSVSDASLRSQMAVVFQEAFLFDISVRENIRLGRLDATDADVEEAARKAQIHDLILTLPQGYDTPVGERGGRLSGGQRQRIALARAVVQDPAILLLDEATSALDPMTEAAFNDTLADFARDRTVVSITHRLSGVKDADLILVLDSGSIVESGTHQELLDQGGQYAAMWSKQSGFVLSKDGQQAQIQTDRLSAIPLFAGLDQAVLAPVASAFFTERYSAGEDIYQQGDPGDKFFILVRGTVEARRSSAGGAVLDGEILQDGDFFGDYELLKDEPRTATIHARSPIIALALARDHFNRLIDAVPVLRAVFEQVAEVRNQRDQVRLAMAAGESGWTDAA
jgi:ATP-binding cassette, subfamily B, bacterial